jgi:hypothetical protein
MTARGTTQNAPRGRAHHRQNEAPCVVYGMPRRRPSRAAARVAFYPASRVRCWRLARRVCALRLSRATVAAPAVAVPVLPKLTIGRSERYSRDVCRIRPSPIAQPGLGHRLTAVTGFESPGTPYHPRPHQFAPPSFRPSRIHRDPAAASSARLGGPALPCRHASPAPPAMRANSLATPIHHERLLARSAAADT